MKMKIALSISLAILASITTHVFKSSINLYMMGFFRDLARIKARKRRYENDKAIMTTKSSSLDDFKLLFLGIESDPLLDLDLGASSDVGEDDVGAKSSEHLSDMPIYTRQELYEYGNAYSKHDDSDSSQIDEDTEYEQQLLISIFGRVYDVSAGHKFYGPEGRYAKFSGHDITYALSTGCTEESCIQTLASTSFINSEIDDNEEDECRLVDIGDDDSDETACSVVRLTDKELKEGKKWLHFFETHDSYNIVGTLKEGISMEQLMDQIIEDDASSEESSPRFLPK